MSDSGVSDRAVSQQVASPPVLARTRAELAAARAGLDPGTGPVVLVPTMGALHTGHQRLLRAARALAGPEGSVLVSIFVNPLQFGPGEDLDRYPRTLDDDLAMCAREGIDLVFAPSAAEMYPGGRPDVTVDPGPTGRVFEGQFRPGFFDGVLTVVLKLLHLTRPATAMFGQKDAQQLALVRRMVGDMDLDVAIESVPTARDADGLATSSRNRYLSAADRAVALALPRALRAGEARAAEGAPAVLAAAQEVLRTEPALAVDYIAVVDPRTFASVREPGQTGSAVLVAAARVGGTRLIDNVPVVLAAGPAAEGQPGDAAAEGQPGDAAAEGQPGDAAAERRPEDAATEGRAGNAAHH
jgi:pantoate--beta-alanine ligase